MIEDQQQNDIPSSGAAKPREPVRTYEYFIVAIVSLIPPISLLVLLATVVDAIVRRRPGSGHLIVTSLVSTLFGVLLAIALPSYVKVNSNTREGETKANLHYIQVALERYWVDHCVYPADIETLFTDGYLSALPENSFTRQPMKEISFGASPYQGEFTYIPYTIDNNVRAYYLIVYGKNGGNGLDLDEDGVFDHAIMLAYNGCGCECLATPRLEQISPPPLKDLLTAQKENPQAQSVVAPENVK